MYNEKENSVCNFAEDLVSYLYGEISASEKGKFEAHLAECGSCAEEISGFGIIRSSVQDWREKDFAPLQTPIIELPEQRRNTALSVNPTIESRSWLAGLREIFRLSPMQVTAAAACAALVIFAGLFYVTVSSPNNSDLVSEMNKFPESKPVVTPTISAQKTPEITKNINPTPPDSPMPPKTSDAGMVKPIPVSEKSLTRGSNKTIEPTKEKSRPKNSGAVKPQTVPNRVKNSSDVRMISDTEDEEETLGLAELFEEVDGK